MTNTPSDAEIDEVTLDVLGYAALDKETNETARMIARAVLAKWGTPQPVAREPLTENQVSGLAESAGYWHGDMSRADFINGIRYAEAAHGITQKGGSNGL